MNGGAPNGAASLRIGIDVGGTNTDAALIDSKDRVIASAKAPTTGDITSGVIEALVRLTPPVEEVAAVMIGTTHFLNALIEGERLAPVAAIRLGLPATASLPPFTDWPSRQGDAVHGASYLVHGGREFDSRPLSAVDPDELKRVAGDLSSRGIRSVAITAVFSPLTDQDEIHAAEILRSELGEETQISLSHQLGRIGLLQRENATIINASLVDLAAVIVDAFGDALRRCGICAPFFLSQNDGTLMDVNFARAYPVSTFASGPTNSMRGAALLSGAEDAAVIDVGGTTTDIGVLANGFPREVSGESRMAGIRTNFRVPDVLSLGIGGGSHVSLNGATGPRSAGYRIAEEALVFGGAQLTATDLAVAGGRADLGDPERLRTLEPGFVQAALSRIDERISEAIDRMRTSASSLPIIAVGGGSILVPNRLPGFEDVRRPQHFEVANAVGAAIAQVGGEIDKIVSLDGKNRNRIFQELTEETMSKATAAGATPGSVKIVDLDEVPLAYLPGAMSRIRIRAVGALNLNGILAASTTTTTITEVHNRA